MLLYLSWELSQLCPQVEEVCPALSTGKVLAGEFLEMLKAQPRTSLYARNLLLDCSQDTSCFERYFFEGAL